MIRDSNHPIPYLPMPEPNDFDALLKNAESQLPLVRDSIQFGSHRVDYYRPSDPESILDEETLLSDHGELEWQPYWAQAWDASVGMAEYLVNQDLKNQCVLDLGCGIGMTSALLLAIGAEVVCGDNAPPSLLFAELNTWPWRQRAQVQFIDWHKTLLEQHFDTIVGSDIVYERQEVGPLDRFFRNHLKPDGKVILSDPSRPMTREFLTMFSQLGWSLEETTIGIEQIKQPIRIVTLTL